MNTVRSTLAGSLWLYAVWVCGCLIDRSALVPEDAGGVGLDATFEDAPGLDAPRSDAGAIDVGPIGVDVPCVASAEVCNERDDDCDGAVDEDFDLDADPSHCGRCDVSCTAGASAAPACTAGVCDLTCDPGFLDCDADPANGCEAAENEATSCGACGVACGASSPVCESDGAGGFRCATGCTAPAELCGGSCVDTRTSVSHCGGCGMACGSRAGATASCVSSGCEYVCRDGLADCNGMPGDGCETSTRTLTNCNGCGTACGFANASASCTTGTCTFVACAPGFGDCDGDLANGCERPLDTITSCGMCGRTCTYAHAAALCASGSCMRGACEPGWDDCNGMATDGCEADLASTSHCGMCGRTCMAGQSCVGGACMLSAGVVEVGAGLAFSCARLSDGRVFCWGDDASGQLGNGAGAASSSAVPVMGLTDAIDLAVGGAHACAVRAGGAVVCWGENQRFQVGDGTMTDRPAPVAAGGISNALRVSAGGEHTCVVRATGAVSCWGRDNVGQLGDGTRGGDRGNGVDVTLPSVALDVDCGGAHTCALLASGEVHCWGENGTLQLGDGTSMDRETAVRAGTLTGAIGLSTGADFTCAVRVGGTIQCWGANDHGQLGDGTTTGRGTLAAVDLLTDAVEVSCGADHTCARNAAGAVSCWGLNGSGRLGDGTTSERTRPVPVPGVTASQLSAGAEHTCAARTDGAAACWGENAAGQLGLGGTTDSSMPMLVTGLP